MKPHDVKMPSVVEAKLKIDNSSTSSAHLFSERPYKEQKTYFAQETSKENMNPRKISRRLKAACCNHLISINPNFQNH